MKTKTDKGSGVASEGGRVLDLDALLDGKKSRSGGSRRKKKPVLYRVYWEMQFGDRVTGKWMNQGDYEGTYDSIHAVLEATSARKAAEATIQFYESENQVDSWDQVFLDQENDVNVLDDPGHRVACEYALVRYYDEPGTDPREASVCVLYMVFRDSHCPECPPPEGGHWKVATVPC